MTWGASELVGRLDVPDRRLDVIRKVCSHERAAPENLRSIEAFEDAYLALIANRILEANSRNEYSVKIEMAAGNIRARSKWLFERLTKFAEAQREPEVRKALFLLLCYLKPESPEFVSRMWSLHGTVDLAHDAVQQTFVEYLLSMRQAAGANVVGLSPIDHFGGTATVSLAGEQMPCRIAAANDGPVRRVFCGCSAADSLLFDTRKHDVDLFITLPGLSLRHLTAPFLQAICESIITKRLAPNGPQVVVTVCVGFVDRLKIAGARQRWERGALESAVDRGVSEALDSIGEVNAAGRSRFQFDLYPGSFPVRHLDRVTVNGVAPFHAANDDLSRLVEERLRGISSRPAALFPRGRRLCEVSLIHDREIHPRLGAEVSAITGPC